MRSRLLYIAAGIPVALICLAILTLLFIPNQEIEGVLIRALASEGYSLHNQRFGLAFPLGIKASGVVVSSQKGELIKLDKFSARLRILPLFLGKIAIGYHGSIGKGELHGEFSPSGKGAVVLEASDIRLEDIPFFQTVAGAQIKGELRAKGSIKGRQAAASGELQLSVRDAQLQGVKIGGMPLPDAAYKTVQGMLQIGGGKATLQSLTFDGDGLYTRLKGDMPLTNPINAAPLNLTLELMPRADFLEKQKFVFLLLLKYQTSPGHYQMPVRGTLGKPSLM